MVNKHLIILGHRVFTPLCYQVFGNKGDRQMNQQCIVAESQIDYATAAMEDRSAPRIKIQIPASLRQSGSSGFSVMIKDLSLSGFAAEALTGMRQGTRVWIAIPSLSPLQAEVEWNDGIMIGCSFNNLLNPAVLKSILDQYHSIDG